MRKALSILIMIVALLMSTEVVHAQQQFKWVKGGGSPEIMPSGAEEESVQYMCTDPNGNVYALSIVGGTAGTPIYADTFYRSTGYGSHNSLLVTSYTCNGVMRWAKLIGATADKDQPSGIVADNAGHVYVTGHFQHAAGSHILYIGYDTSTNANMYLSEGLIQLDTNGHFNWLRFIGVNTLKSYSATSAVAPVIIDGANNVHMLPYVGSGMPFRPGDTSAYGVYDLTYDPSGTLLSTVRLDMDSQWAVQSAAIDPVTNKLYVTGEINIYIYGGFLTDTFYAAAFDASRHKIWQYFTANNNGISGLTFDQNKHLYFSAGSSGTAFVFNGASVPAGDISVVMRTDTNGTVNWMKRYSCTTSGNYLQGITSLPNNKVAAVGGFGGVLTGMGVSLSSSGEGQNAFMGIWDSLGDLQYMDQLHGKGFYDWGYAITSDKIGNIYLGGEVTDSIWASTPKIPAYYTVGGGSDFFVAKYGVDCSCTAMPVSMFANSGTHTLSVSYTGTTAGLDSVVWSFGDGSATVKGTPTSHTYSVAGTYRVTAMVYTTCGNDIYGKDVVIACGTPPVAAFTTSGVHPLNVAYTGTTSTVDSVVWDFGDGGKAKGTTAAHTYAAAGTYAVCCTAWSLCGNSTTCKTITIPCGSAPVASFTSTGTYSLATTYTGTTVALDSIVWAFGDGGKATGTTASHTYSALGTYTVCVTAYSPCGSATSCHVITVLCLSAPTASYSSTGDDTLSVTYTGTTSAIDSIVWDFGDGSAKVKGTPPAHTYSVTGTYHVCVTAYNPCGSNTFCTDNIIRCLIPPVASFSDTGKKKMGFTYSGTTIGMDSIVWNFGDGNTARGNTALHTYNSTNTYSVCVTIYTPCGIDSACKSVTAYGLAVSEVTNGAIKVFPNPANDELNITGIEQKTNYRLLSVSGVTIQRGTMERGINTLQMQQIVPGVYVLEMTGESGERNNVRVVKE